VASLLGGKTAAAKQWATKVLAADSLGGRTAETKNWRQIGRALSGSGETVASNWLWDKTAAAKHFVAILSSVYSYNLYGPSISRYVFILFITKIFCEIRKNTSLDCVGRYLNKNYY